jgi:hypothetical protein
MIFSIKPEDRLIELQQKFTKIFPGLKIEFFRNQHDRGESNIRAERFKGALTIAEIQPKLEPLTFIIEPEFTVEALEGKFRDRAQLNVQVFRKMGNVWLETVQTDSYTLQKQMDLSAESHG